MAYHLLNKKNCKLIVNMRLTDLKGNIISHFLAWNGKVVIVHPNSSKVNDTTDRKNPEKSKLAFSKLFPGRMCSSWRITSVYQLY